MARPVSVLEWVIRDDGNDLNGTGYLWLDGDSVDYSDQAAAQASYTDV